MSDPTAPGVDATDPGPDETVVDAATTLLVRDGDEGLEVLLLERHIRSDFAGGAYVFPGGKVDDRDRTLEPSRWSGADLSAWAPRLGATEDLALGLLVAGVREAFEEAGVLLATRAGSPLTAADLASPSFREARAALAARRSTFDWRPWLAEEDLVLDLGALTMWSWWMSPVGMPRAYDTRFFVVEAPAALVESASHDEVETTASTWIRPEVALADAAAGRMTVIFPTRKNLAALAAFPTARGAVAAAAAGEVELRQVRPAVVPLPDGGHGVRHPYTGEVEAV